MENKPVKDNRTKLTFNILLVLILFTCAVLAVKRIFIGLDVDEEYAVALAYRIANGDILMKEMWEPHMLSGLFLAFPIWLFLLIRRDTEFIIMALRIYGVLLQGMVCLAWYRVWRKRTSPIAALASAALIFATLPKFIQTPEFANVQIWFLLLTGLCIMAAEEGKHKGFYLLAGVCYIIQLLSYPTLIVLLPVYLVLLAGKKGMMRFLIPIFVFGAGFFLFILKFAGLDTALSSVGYVLSDSSHSGGFGSKLAGYAAELPAMLLHLLIYAAIAIALSAVISMCAKIRIGSRVFLWQTLALFVAVSFLDQLRFWFVLRVPNVHPQYRFAALLIAAVIMYVTQEKHSKEKDREAFAVFAVASFIAMLAILTLTNLDVKATLVHLLPSGAFWIVLCGENTKPQLDGDSSEAQRKATVKGCVIAAVVILLGVNWFGQAFLVRVNNEGKYENVLFADGGKRLSFHGPSRRIYCGYWDGEEKNANYDFLRNTVPEGSRVLYCGNGSTLYLMNRYDVCAPSVISTPAFNHTTIEYFALNPQKKPEYIVVENSFLDEQGSLTESKTVSADFCSWFSDLTINAGIYTGDYITVIHLKK